MPKEQADNPNPGTEGNESTPVDEGQSRQIGDLLTIYGQDSKPTGNEAPTRPQEEARREFEEYDNFEEPAQEDLSDDYDLQNRRRGEDEGHDANSGGSESESSAVEGPAPQASEIQQLKAEIAEVKGMLQGLSQGRSQEEPEAEPELPSIQVNPEDFLTEDEIDEFTVDPGKVLRQLAARVYSRAREDTLKDMPDVVSKATQRHVTLTQARQEFWSKNADLLQKSQENPTVATLIRVTANEVQSENPHFTVEQVFNETGLRVRKTLGLHAQAQKIESSSRPAQHPGKPRSKRRGGSSEDTRTPEQKQLDQMLASIRR